MSKKKFLGGRNSNVYIVFYSAIMVIIVAVALAFTNQSLKEKQGANILNEKKDAIVASLGLEKGTYDKLIDAYVVNEKGEKVVFADKNEEQMQNYIFELLGGLPAAYAENTLVVFEDKESGEIVVPVTGKGLWGDIWGYVALKSDMNTIKGVIFDHKGETPGLGAEIATPKYCAQFTNTAKTIYNEAGEFVGISVVKGGGTEENPHAVDAVTGGTKTSEGLEKMIKECLVKYDAFFKSRSAAGECQGEATECAGTCAECTEVETK